MRLRTIALVMVLTFVSPALAGDRGVVHVTVPPEGIETVHEGRRVAFVVGINEYDDEVMGDLKYAVQDAIALEDLLREQGGFAVTSATGSGRVEKATFWYTWDTITAGLQRNDTFVVYFAGHGTVTQEQGGNQQHLMFSDSSMDDQWGTGIQLEDLEDRLEELPARRRLLILDSCFSGDGRSRLAPQVLVEQQRGTLAPPPPIDIGRFDVRMYAAHWHQPARESDELQHGVYTHCLLQALQGEGDATGDGIVDALEAHDSAVRCTLGLTDNKQEPWWRGKLVGGEAMQLSSIHVEVGPPVEQAMILGVHSLPGNHVVKVDGADHEGGAVNPGNYKIDVVVDGLPYLCRIVRLGPGERVDVAELVAAKRSEKNYRRLSAFTLGGGIEVVTSDQISAPVLGQISFWGWSPRWQAGRFGLGAAVSVGYGEINDFGPFMVGDVLGNISWIFGDQWAVGPRVTAGMVWRNTEAPEGPKFIVGPAFVPGIHAQLMTNKGFVALDPSIWLLPTWDGLTGEFELVRVGFGVTITAGARL